MLNSLTNDPTQADSIAPGDNGHRTKMYKSSHTYFVVDSLTILFCRDNPPPSTSFASDKKKTLGIRQFPNVMWLVGLGVILAHDQQPLATA